MSNLYREPSIDASYQVSVQLAKQGRRILEQPKLGWEAPMDGSVLSFLKAE
jgi:hypothetical protein